MNCLKYLIINALEDFGYLGQKRVLTIQAHLEKENEKGTHELVLKRITHEF